jgi:dTDP-4-amino-4,6-dideoxygalactose transaminase
MIPFLDLARAHEELRADIEAAVARVLAAGHYVGGSEVAAFEQAFADFVEAGHCIGVNSGLDALTLALRALQIGPGDEVIVPAHTFVATWLSVSATGAIPVPVDVEPNGFNLDPGALETALTARTRAIVPVHLYGRPANLSAVQAFAEKHGLRVIEDAAQAHGAFYSGRRIGAQSDAACWSFYPSKNLGAAGDGGAVTSDDGELIDAVRRFANYGEARKYHHELRGTNSRLDAIQAAVLSAKLPYLDDWNRRRRLVAERYTASLGDTDLGLPPGGVDESVWHLYVVRSADRDRLQARMHERGVETRIHYPVPPHRQPAFRECAAAPGSLPRTDMLAGEVLSLPMGPHLHEDEIAAVIEAVRSSV